MSKRWIGAMALVCCLTVGGNAQAKKAHLPTHVHAKKAKATAKPAQKVAVLQVSGMI